MYIVGKRRSEKVYFEKKKKLIKVKGALARVT